MLTFHSAGAEKLLRDGHSGGQSIMGRVSDRPGSMQENTDIEVRAVLQPTPTSDMLLRFKYCIILNNFVVYIRINWD